MATAQLNLETVETPTEHARAADWRYEQLRHAGYSVDAASALADRNDIDLHAAVELLENGCEPELALRILR